MQKLENLNAGEISLVNQGANRRRFIVFKSADGKGSMTTHEELQKAIAGADPEVMKKVSDFLDKAIKKDDANAGVARTGAQAVSRIAACMKGKISPEAMHGLLDSVGFQVTPTGEGEGEKGGAGAMTNGQAPSHGIEKDFQALPAEHLEKMKSMDGKSQKDYLEKLGYRMYPDAQVQMKTKSGEPAESKKEEGTVEKTAPTAQLDAATQAKLDAVFKAHEDLTKENKDLRTELAALTQVNKNRELVTKAASFTGVGLPQEQIVAMLADAQKVGQEAFDRVVKSFETLSEQNRVAKSFGGSLYGEIGSAMPGGSQGGESTWSRIEKAAEAYVAKSGDAFKDCVTSEQRVAKFLETSEGLRLYQEHQAARKDGI